MYTEQEQNILAAALEVFGERGREGAKIQEVADRAGVNKALVHYYFRSKDRLYDLVIDSAISNYFEKIGRVMEEADTFEQLLKSTIDTYLDIFTQQPHIRKLFFGEMLRDEESFKAKLRQSVERAPREVVPTFIKKMKQAQAAGEVRDLDPLQTFVSMIGCCIIIFIAFPMLSANIPEVANQRDALIAARREHIFELLYNGLRNTPAPGEISDEETL